MSLFAELKRRNVIRVGVAYVVASWVLLQVLDVVAPLLALPEWSLKLVLAVLALGLLPALVFAWAFELTPEGIKREHEVDRSHSVTGQTARRLDQVTIGMLLLVVALIIVDRTIAPSAEAPAATAVSERSIAVLAFEDLSQDGDQAWFAEGLSEELLNLLAQVPDLQVAGRTSSFAFKGEHRDLREIGELLDVAHVLEGSVRKAGNRIRVTAQLVSTADGFHLFSQTYDDELSDIFAVQDAIARQITDALKTELIGATAVEATPVTNIRAYELYLEARQKIRTRDQTQIAQASDLLDAALIIDPDYPPALAHRALATTLLSNGPGFYGDTPEAEAYATAEHLISRALQGDPELAEAHALRGLVRWRTTSPESALPHLQRALAINPNLDDARLWMANLLGDLGRDDEEMHLQERIVEHDPLFGPAFANLVGLYLNRGWPDKALALINRVERAGGGPVAALSARALVAEAQGRLADAVRLYQQARAAGLSGNARLNHYSRVLETLGNYSTMRELGQLHIKARAELLATGTYNPTEVEAAFPPGDNLVYFNYHAYMYHLTGDTGRTIAVVENSYGGLTAMLAAHPLLDSTGTGYMSNLAYAYRQRGNQAAFEQTLAAMRRALDAQQQRPVDPLDLWYGEVEYAALRDDLPALRTALQQMVDLNAAGVEPLLDPVLRPYAGDPQVQPLLDIFRERAEAARAELGWPPYTPIDLEALGAQRDDQPN